MATASSTSLDSRDRFTFWLCVGLGLLLGLLVYSGKQLYLFFALCVPLSFLVFLSTEALVVLLLFAHFTLEWLVLQFNLPSRIMWGFEGIIFLLVAKALLQEKHGPGREGIGRPLRFVVLLVLFASFSMLVNFIDPVSAALGFRKWFRYPLLFWALAQLFVSERFSRLTIRLFVALMLLQVPVCLYQKFLGVASTVSTGDTVVGTLGPKNTHALGVLCVVAISLLVGLYQETREKRLLYPIPLLFIPPTVAEVKAFYVFTALVCLYLFKGEIIRNPRAALAWGTSFALLMVASFTLYDSIYTYREKDRFRIYESRVREPLSAFLLDPQKLLSYEMQNRSIQVRWNSDKQKVLIGRIEAINLVNSSITEQWSTAVFGHGIGSYTKSSLNEDQAQLQAQSLAGKASEKHLVASGLMELGYGGLLLMAFLWWGIYRDNRKRLDFSVDPFWRGFARGFQGIVVLMAIASFYLGSFLYGEQTSFIFWLLFALLSQHYMRAGEQPRNVTFATP